MLCLISLHSLIVSMADGGNLIISINNLFVVAVAQPDGQCWMCQVHHGDQQAGHLGLRTITTGKTGQEDW